MLLSQRRLVSGRCSRADGTPAAKASVPTRRSAPRVTPVCCATADEQPAMTVEDVQGIMKKMDQGTATGKDTQASQSTTEERPKSLLRVLPQTNRLESKILDLLSSAARPSLAVSDPFVLTRTINALHNASQLLQQQGKDEVIVFRPSVRRGTLTTFLRSGATPDSELYFNLSTVPASKAQAEPKPEVLIKVTNEGRWEAIAGLAYQFLTARDEAHISAVGGPGLLVAVKAFLSASYNIRKNVDEDLRVLPVVRTVTASEGRELEVLVLQLTKVPREARTAPAEGTSSGTDRPPRAERPARTADAERRPYNASRTEGRAAGATRTDRRPPREAARRSEGDGSSSSGDITISAEKWKAINEQLETLTKLNAQLAELVMKQQQQQKL